MSETFESSPNLFKVYIKQVAVLPSEAIAHIRVICAFCYSCIKGSRYKCTVCENYDLCFICYNKNIHPQHSLNFIPEPVNAGGKNIIQRGFSFFKENNIRRPNKHNPAIDYK